MKNFHWTLRRVFLFGLKGSFYSLLGTLKETLVVAVTLMGKEGYLGWSCWRLKKVETCGGWSLDRREGLHLGGDAGLLKKVGWTGCLKQSMERAGCWKTANGAMVAAMRRLKVLLAEGCFKVAAKNGWRWLQMKEADAGGEGWLDGGCFKELEDGWSNGAWDGVAAKWLRDGLGKLLEMAVVGGWSCEDGCSWRRRAAEREEREREREREWERERERERERREERDWASRMVSLW